MASLSLFMLQFGKRYPKWTFWNRCYGTLAPFPPLHVGFSSISSSFPFWLSNPFIYFLLIWRFIAILPCPIIGVWCWPSSGTWGKRLDFHCKFILLKMTHRGFWVFKKKLFSSVFNVEGKRSGGIGYYWNESVIILRQLSTFTNSSKYIFSK